MKARGWKVGGIIVRKWENPEENPKIPNLSTNTTTQKPGSELGIPSIVSQRVETELPRCHRQYIVYLISFGIQRVTKISFRDQCSRF